MAYFSATGTGGGQTNKPVLLWINPNPTSTFKAQTINVDASNYEYLIFKICADSNATTPYYSYVGIKHDNNKFGIGTNSNANTSVGNGGYIRNYDTSDNVIKISTGYTTAGAANTRYAIPLEIYGLKKALL